MITEKELQRALKKGAKMAPKVRGVRYHHNSDQIEFATSWCVILLNRDHIPELKDISKDAMRDIQFSPTGIHLEEADIDINLGGLISALARDLEAEAMHTE